MCLCCVAETSGWLGRLSAVYKRLFLRPGGCYLHSDPIHPVCILAGRGKQQRAGWRKAKNACSWWAANSKERRQKLNKAFPVFLLELINAMMVFLRRSKQWGREEPEESYVHMKSKFRNAGGPFPKHPSIQLSSHCVALLPCIRH